MIDLYELYFHQSSRTLKKADFMKTLSYELKLNWCPGAEN